MENTRIATLALVLALAAPLAAQEPHFGLGLSLSIPTGSFNSNTYFPPGQGGVASTEGYDSTLGGQFTVSFPVDPRLALRVDVYGQSTSGTDSAPGYQSYNLEHDLLSLGGEAQFFPGGGAYRHVGGYLLGGVSMDLERFRSSYGDPGWSGYSVGKTRLGGLAGVGYSFRPVRGWHSNVELAFHKTLTSYDDNGQPTVGNPATPPADFVRMTYGIVF